MRGFEGQNVAERGLRPFDLRGDDGLLANEAVEEPIRARHHRSRHPEARHVRLRGGVEFRCRAIHHKWRIGWGQGVWNERPDLLSKGADGVVLTGLASHG